MKNAIRLSCIAFLILFLVYPAFAQDTSDVSQANSQGQILEVNNKPESGFDFGMPETSSADPEYVAQEKMVEGLTSAYNWIAENSVKFADGCANDKPSIVKEIVLVIQQAQEASTVCKRFEEDSKSCSPETFCAKFSKGNLPLPSNTTSVMKKLGYDPDTMKIEEITEELIVKVCRMQSQPMYEEQIQMAENAKSKIKEQLPEFRTKCEEFKKQKAQNNGFDVKLPDFSNTFNRQVVVTQGPNQPMQPQNTYAPGTGPAGGICQEPHPDCGTNGGPFCNQGRWECPQGIQPQNTYAPGTSGGGNYCPEPRPNCDGTGPPSCNQGRWECPQGVAPQNIVQTTPPMAPLEPVPVVEPATVIDTPVPTTTESATEPQAPVETTSPEPTASTLGVLNIATGLITGTEGETARQGFVDDGTKKQAICGDGICAKDLGEDDKGCPKDCMTSGSGQGPIGDVYAPANNGNVVQNTVGPSPEVMCEMSDDEIIGMYTKDMEKGMPGKEEMEYNCKQQSSKVLNEINKFKLEKARCKANIALDCLSKQKASQSCSKMQENPQSTAEMIVNNMCRRFVKVEKKTNLGNSLYTLAEKWSKDDPALASQLGDTADLTEEDQKKLDVLSYFIGNGDYAAKIKERSANLKEIKKRLISKDSADEETIAALDAQTKELDAEVSKFSNLFDLSRLGYILGRN